MLFFVFYVAIALLEARREAIEVKRPVDGMLVFGVVGLVSGAAAAAFLVARHGVRRAG